MTQHVASAFNSRPPLLAVKGLRVAFRDPTSGRLHRAVEDASFEIPHNAVVGLTGESGSGKTTTALSLMGLVKGDPGVVAGQIWLDGRLLFDAEALAHLSAHARSRQLLSALAPHRGRDLFMIFQEPRASLNPYWRVEKQLRECVLRQGRNLTPEQIRNELHALLEAVWLPYDVLDMYPAELSTGMCQRVMIAMALALRVKLLVADEPLSRIDLRLRRKVIAALDSIRASRTMAILLCTHDLNLLRQLADIVVVMFRGRVVEVGHASVVLDPRNTSPRHEYTARLLAAYDLIEDARGHVQTSDFQRTLESVCRGRLRKQAPIGGQLLKVDKAHWVRQ